MIDPLARYDLAKLHMQEAQKEAQLRALVRRPRFTTWGPLLKAAVRLSPLRRGTAPAAACHDQAFCAAGC